MAFKFPWSNLHELNLDWILSVVKRFSELVPPMETAVEDVQSLQADVEQAVTDAQAAVTTANEASETAAEALEVAEQAAGGVIADGAVTTDKIANGAVTMTKIATGAVTSAKIMDGTIIADDMADGAVTTDKIAAGAVTTPKIYDSAITPVKVINGSFNFTQLDSDTVVDTYWGSTGIFWGKISQFFISIKGNCPSSSSWHSIGNIPTAYAPSSTLEINTISVTTGQPVSFRIMADGSVGLRNNSGSVFNTSVSITIAYLNTLT